MGTGGARGGPGQPVLFERGHLAGSALVPLPRGDCSDSAAILVHLGLVSIRSGRRPLPYARLAITFSSLPTSAALYVKLPGARRTLAYTKQPFESTLLTMKTTLSLVVE